MTWWEYTANALGVHILGEFYFYCIHIFCFSLESYFRSSKKTWECALYTVLARISKLPVQIVIIVFCTCTNNYKFNFLLPVWCDFAKNYLYKLNFTCTNVQVNGWLANTVAERSLNHSIPLRFAGDTIKLYQMTLIKPIFPKLPLKHRLLNCWRWFMPWECPSSTCLPKYDTQS